MTNVIILFMAVGLLVAAIRATSSTPERVIFALLGAAGIGFVGWAQVTGFVLPPITLNANWPLVAAVLTFAFIGTGISTGSTRWSALGVISFTWLAWLLLSFSWIALALVAAGILLALMFSTQQQQLHVNRPQGYRWFAAGALVALLAGATVAVNTTSEENILAAALGKQLNTNNAFFTSRAEACKNPQGDLVWICAGFAQNDATDAAQDKAIAAIRNRLGIVELATTGVTIIGSPGGMNDEQAVKALAAQLAAAGWGPNDVRINSVDETLHKEHAGTARFNERLRTKAKLVEYLNGSSPAQVANRNLVLSSVPTDQHDRLLRGEGYYAVQFLQASCLQGNGFWKDGKVLLDGQNCHDAGDILWIYVGSDGRVYWGATVRDDCGNGSLDQAPTPKRRTTTGNGGGSRTPVCPAGTDRAGQQIGDKACSNPRPKLVPVCSQDGTKVIQVPAAEADKYPKPNADGTCLKVGSNPGLNSGEGGSGGVNGNNGATDSRGLQNDPAADAAAAAAKAAADAKAAEEAAKAAADAASTDSGAGTTPQGPSSGASTGDGGDQSGATW
ncbi:MAG TPA: hypothetical protein PKV96_01150 [Candidatus Saccharimonas sp.]|jgi:hypothetical protein|nr:hypothetical protein [Candidatus Saccharimonas sp.]